MGFTSIAQVRNWKRLKEDVDMTSFTLFENHNKKAFDKYDEAVEALVKFEQQNNIKSLNSILT